MELEEAIERNNLKKVKEYLDELPNVDLVSSSYDPITYCPLEYACEKGSMEIVKYLVERGANITDSVLWYASEESHREILKYLLEKGADKNKALIAASGAGHLETVKYLLEKGADKNKALIPASRYGHLNIVKYLVENGVNVNITEIVKEKEGDVIWVTKVTPLTSACTGYGNMETIEYLVENGANDITNALQIAKHQTFQEDKVIEFLEKHLS